MPTYLIEKGDTKRLPTPEEARTAVEGCGGTFNSLTDGAGGKIVDFTGDFNTGTLKAEFKKKNLKYNVSNY